MDNEKDNLKDTKNIEIMWVEGDGIGYCLTEEDYEKRKQEVKNKNNK